MAQECGQDTIPFYEVMGMSAVGRKFDLFGTGEGGNTLLMKKPLEKAKPQLYTDERHSQH